MKHLSKTLLVLLSLTLFAGISEAQKTLKELKEISEKCFKKIKISSDQKNRLLSYDYFNKNNDSRKTQCYIKCLLSKANLYNINKSELNVEEFVKLAAGKIEEKRIQYCDNGWTKVEGDTCLTAYRKFMCIFDSEMIGTVQTFHGNTEPIKETNPYMYQRSITEEKYKKNNVA